MQLDYPVYFSAKGGFGVTNAKLRRTGKDQEEERRRCERRSSVNEASNNTTWGAPVDGNTREGWLTGESTWAGLKGSHQAPPGVCVSTSSIDATGRHDSNWKGKSRKQIVPRALFVTGLLLRTPPGWYATESCSPATSSNDRYIRRPAACTFRTTDFRARSPATDRLCRALLRGASHVPARTVPRLPAG